MTAAERSIAAIAPRRPPGPPRVLILAFTDLARDPRVNRQVRYLAERYAVTAAGLVHPGVAGIAFVPLTPGRKRVGQKAVAGLRLLGRSFESYYWNRSEVVDAWPRLRGLPADLVVANDIDTLPLALRLAGGAKVLFDAHEYAPLEFEDLLFFRVFIQRFRRYLCRTYIPRVDAMTTVCDGLGDAYEKDVGVRATVVWNAPDYEPLEPSPVGAKIRLVHHGIALPSRRLEATLALIPLLDQRFDLTLLLTEGTPGYLDALKRKAAGNPRIRFLPPVPMRELPRFLNAFDVGVFLLPPTNFNYRHALPNKLFEFVQARLAVAIGPSPEMAALVNRHGLGIVAEDFTPESLARNLQALDPTRIGELKAQSHAAARILSADSVRAGLLGLAEDLLGRGRE